MGKPDSAGAGGKISPEAVRETFRGALRGSDRLPGSSACGEVAEWLRYLRARERTTSPAAERRAASAWRAVKVIAGGVAELEAVLAELAPARPRVAWHAEAEGLAEVFRAACPERPHGSSADGPLARWVAAALALAIGARVSPAAVSRRLQRAARRKNISGRQRNG